MAKESVFVSRTAAAKGDDPREFSYEGDTYQIALSPKGEPDGISYFGGKAPTFIGAGRMTRIASPAFLSAAENAALKTVEAVKAKALVYAPAKNRKNQVAMRWQIASAVDKSLRMPSVTPTVPQDADNA